jgi:hypothetical protein
MTGIAVDSSFRLHSHISRLMSVNFSMTGLLGAEFDALFAETEKEGEE